MGHDWLIGKQLGPYHIREKLGEGAMGQVYKAYHALLGREAAIKLLLSWDVYHPDSRNRFRREAQMIAGLHHRNIIAVYDFNYSEDLNLAYLAMQYVDGGTLRNQLKSRQPLDPRQAALYALQIARALHHAHQHGIIHRDVKPENILISSTNRNELLLSDFGIARLFEERQKAASQPSPPLSGENAPAFSRGAGTPYYMAPEQFRGQAVDARTDVYALGVVLFEMLTGERPFQTDNGPAWYAALHHQHVSTLPKSVRKINPAVPEALEQITARALAKAPEERYQSAGEMAQALKTVLAPTLPHKSLVQIIPPIAIILYIVLTIVQFLINRGILHWPGIGTP